MAGLYPDVLLPKQTFDVEPYKNQALWLSAWVPEDAVPGTYRSVIRVKTADGQAVTAVALLQVYPVTVPKLGKLKTCWVSQPANTDKWNKLTAELTAKDTDLSGQLLLLTDRGGHLYLDVVSLFLHDKQAPLLSDDLDLSIRKAENPIGRQAFEGKRLD